MAEIVLPGLEYVNALLHLPALRETDQLTRDPLAIQLAGINAAQDAWSWNRTAGQAIALSVLWSAIRNGRDAQAHSSLPKEKPQVEQNICNKTLDIKQPSVYSISTLNSLLCLMLELKMDHETYEALESIMTYTSRSDVLSALASISSEKAKQILNGKDSTCPRCNRSSYSKTWDWAAASVKLERIRVSC